MSGWLDGLFGVSYGVGIILTPQAGFEYSYKATENSEWTKVCFKNTTDKQIEFPVTTLYSPSIYSTLPTGVERCDKPKPKPCHGDPKTECALVY